MNLRRAMCESLIDGWNSDWSMGRVVRRGWLLTDKHVPDQIAEFELASKAIRVKHIDGHMPAKVWIARNMLQLNDSLYDGRPRETCVAIALRVLGVHVGVTRIVSVRERDKRHDWNTVK